MPDRKGQSYYRPMPVDFELLERMPEKGMIGGVHWRGRRAKDIREEMLENANGELTPEMLPMSLIQSRLRSMRVDGLIENYPGAGGNTKMIWARLAKGNDLLARKEEVLGT